MLIAAVLGFCFVLVFAATVSFIVFSDSDISVFNNKDDESETLQKKNDRNESAGTKGQFDESDVPEGAVSFGGHRYYIIEDPDVNDWDSANAGFRWPSRRMWNIRDCRGSKDARLPLPIRASLKASCRRTESRPISTSSRVRWRLHRASVWQMPSSTSSARVLLW